MESIKCFGDLKVGDIIYSIDVDSGMATPYYKIIKIITDDYGNISFECDYYESKYGKASYSGDIRFPKHLPYHIYRQDIYLSDPNLGELCRYLVSLKVQSMAEKFNDLFGGLFKIEI